MASGFREMSKDRESETAYGRLIREAKEEAFHARRQLRREQPNPSHETKLDVAAALADYHDVLTDYSDETALKTDWSDRLETDPDVLLSETVTVEKPTQSRNHSATQRQDAPKAIAMKPEELLAMAKELDAIAKELGFAASARDPTPNTKADPDDLTGLLVARGQDQALDNLPDSWRGENDVDGE